MTMKMRIIEILLIAGIFLFLILFILQINNNKKIDYYSVSNDIIKNNNQIYTALYINLDSRKDRKEQIEDELEKQEFYNFVRFDAVKDQRKGYIGCSKSHLECIKIAKENQYPYVIIFEDDFEFLVDKNEFHNLLNKLLNVDYDVFILSYNTTSNDIYPTEDPLLYTIKNTQTASGYIVNRRYYDKLINNFQEGIDLLVETDEYSNYAIDQYWKRLQDVDIWLCYKKRLGKQRASYSDIEKREVDYQV